MLRYSLQLKPSDVPRRSNKRSQLLRKLFHLTRLAQSHTKHCFSITPLVYYLTSLLLFSIHYTFSPLSLSCPFSSLLSINRGRVFFIFYFSHFSPPWLAHLDEFAAHDSVTRETRWKERKKESHQHVNVSHLDRPVGWGKWKEVTKLTVRKRKICQQISARSRGRRRRRVKLTELISLDH